VVGIEGAVEVPGVDSGEVAVGGVGLVPREDAVEVVTSRHLLCYIVHCCFTLATH
jgi:hypothetical protein